MERWMNIATGRSVGPCWPPGARVANELAWDRKAQSRGRASFGRSERGIGRALDQLELFRAVILAKTRKLMTRIGLLRGRSLPAVGGAFARRMASLCAAGRTEVVGAE